MHPANANARTHTYDRNAAAAESRGYEPQVKVIGGELPAFSPETVAVPELRALTMAELVADGFAAEGVAGGLR